jgi:hypothetical protein
MSRTPTWLLEHARNVHSQTGEDGIIEKILEMLPGRDGWCVEFGAWDGLHLTNTRHLILDKGYSAVLIEADPVRYRQLQKNYADRAAVITKQGFVGFTAADGLDALCRDTPLPVGFDLLSIDIDGNDYHVWKAIERYRPKVVVIEFNQTIATPVRFVQPADPALSQGSSLLSLVELGGEKGYELVCVAEHNAFFVRSEYFALFELATNAPEVLRTSTKDVTYLFSGYDGTVFLRGGGRLPWHKLRLPESRFQLLPAYLRRFPDNYSPFQDWLFRWYRTYLKLRDAVRPRGGRDA